MFNVNLTELLAEVLKLFKLDEENSLAVLEYPENSGNVYFCY